MADRPSPPAGESGATPGATSARKLRMPRGVILIASLLSVGALLVGMLGLLVPGATLEQANLPRSLLLSGALVTGILAYGLFRMRRWAWGATISFVVVNLSFVLPNLSVGAGSVLGAALLLLAGVYMLLPSVRGSFSTQRHESARTH